MDKPHTQFDWGRPHQCVEEDMMTREIQRRTFWSCFFVDKLLSNGRDRPSAIHEEDVFCHNPISEEDFIFRRFHQNSSSNKVGISHEQETNLYVFLIRIICILGEIMTWHGRGGRFSDKCAPWNMDMPFTVLDQKLDTWKAQIPDHLKYSSDTFTALSILSSSQAKPQYRKIGGTPHSTGGKASVHALLATIDEEEDVGFSQTAQKLLQDDIKAMEKLKRFWDLATHWVNQIEFYRAILKSSRTSNEESSGKGHNSLADGIMNYIRQSRVIKEDRVQTAIVHPVHPVEQRADSDPSVVFQPKFVEPSKRRGPASTRSPTNLYSAASHHAFRDLVPSGESTGQAQNQNDIDWTGLPIDGGQASGLTTFLPMLDENLENQVASLANWDYVQF
ncbi:hypothetical protein N7449_007613 [Penicillium cf. viridicatum]|uniref:Xylanolytic transcriptional activator regulatory domain-containing protein n=1 Tax=Penicillium cf. viridicatum TaxID=2972119 RepID=A0A9W9JIV4_9EURO|nr:hypothetical protein N7449_007613 [Penicillium cf. viridicatum]